jgi:hypothetical protein
MRASLSKNRTFADHYVIAENETGKRDSTPPGTIALKHCHSERSEEPLNLPLGVTCEIHVRFAQCRLSRARDDILDDHLGDGLVVPGCETFLATREGIEINRSIADVLDAG